MLSTSISPPFPIFSDRDGHPLDNGYVWIGEANLTPQTNPVSIYSDSALSVLAAQPLRTINGYISQSGTPAKIYIDGSSFSILVQDSKGAMVYSSLNNSSDIIDSCSVTYDPPFTGGVALPVCEKLSQTVSVNDFGAAGDGVSDDTQAFMDAFSTGKAVYAPAGTYLTDIQTMPSNSYLFGDGASTVIKPLNPDSRSALGTLPEENEFISNITLRDIKLLGDVVGSGFSEQKHLAAFNGVNKLHIERCIFEGFRGDGLYIGTGNGDGFERHNKNVIIKDCLFNGVNNDNRQGISIIDIDGILIQGNRFQNCTRANMPGAIDFEPDSQTYTVIRNASVVNNNFYNIGGNVGVISFFFVTPETWVNSPCNFIVDSNTFENCANTPLFAGLSIATGTADDLEDQNFIFSNNIARNCSRFAVQFFNTKNLKLLNNTLYKITNDARMAGGTATNIDMLVSGNSFIECGYSTGSGFIVFNAQRLTIESNLFKDCGAGGGAAAIVFETGTSSYVSIINNVITSPQAITTVAIQKEAGHTFTPSTNQFFGNTLTVSGNFFESTYNDTLETTYTPVVTGSTTDGVGTYTNQTGRWRRLGNQVFFRTEVTCSSHTGTGMIQISLPTTTTAAPSQIWTAVSLVATGVTSTGGHIGLINPDLTVGGNKAVRAYYSAAGTVSQMLIPAGAFTVYVAGVYSLQ